MVKLSVCLLFIYLFLTYFGVVCPWRSRKICKTTVKSHNLCPLFQHGPEGRIGALWPYVWHPWSRDTGLYQLGAVDQSKSRFLPLAAPKWHSVARSWWLLTFDPEGSRYLTCLFSLELGVLVKSDWWEDEFLVFSMLRKNLESTTFTCASDILWLAGLPEVELALSLDLDLGFFG